ncbi:hypothetical protein BDZ91DRAFT_731857 [Kalaharituber pfeilii]|nr:hypothetical protein BDZ91DRAFT_731857 [Kalaharituber pfeilii]
MATAIARHRIPAIPTLSHSLVQSIPSSPTPVVLGLRALNPGLLTPANNSARSYSCTAHPLICPRSSSLPFSVTRSPIIDQCTAATPSKASQYPTWHPLGAIRSFHTSNSLHRDYHFDTLKLVQRLQEEGFTKEQSVAMMNVLSDVIEESVQNLTRTMVPKAEQEKITYTQKVDFSQLRSDLHTHHSTEYTSTRNEYEHLSSEIAKLNSRLREEIIRAQNSIKLDLNLEKGRIREEASVHELKIKETDTRIETEVGIIRGTLEAVKFSTLQWLIGVCTGTAALILGVWRLLA